MENIEEFTSIINTIVSLSKTYFQVIITLCISLTTLYIAYQQYRTNRAKLDYDLFEKRHNIYLRLDGLVSNVINNANVDNAICEELYQLEKEAKFLFEKDIINIMKEIREKFHLYLYTQRKLKDTKIKIEEREGLSSKQRQILIYLSDLNYTDVFLKYVSFNVKK